VGVNQYVSDDTPLPLLRIDPLLEGKQRGRLEAVRARRSGEDVEEALGRLREAAAGDVNLMDALLDCARVHASEGEIVESLQAVFGTYTETPVF
jgi:methylmalonyl-CoA mutase N-terminal domain/subunit